MNSHYYLDNLAIYINIKKKNFFLSFSEKSGFEPPGVKHNI
jgi:hypothetical protein